MVLEIGARVELVVLAFAEEDQELVVGEAEPEKDAAVA